MIYNYIAKDSVHRWKNHYVPKTLWNNDQNIYHSTLINFCLSMFIILIVIVYYFNYNLKNKTTDTA
jgi:Na+/melibiose symporter-like transporter